VADINPGLGDSSPADLTVFGDHLYFSANGGTSGRALWRTDGTTTAVVADINPGTGQHLGVDDRFRAVQ
jgi:ELWxxDGT repeat protein